MATREVVTMQDVWQRRTIEVHGKDNSVPKPTFLRNVILVRGISQNTREDVVRLFFKNKRRSGGGSVDTIVYDKVKGEATVTFLNIEDALRVLQHGELSLEDAKLTVTSAVEISPTWIVMITGTNPATSQVMMEEFIKNKSQQSELESCVVDGDSSVAVIEFKNLQGIVELMKADSLVLDGARLTITNLNGIYSGLDCESCLSKAVHVSGFDNRLSVDDLTMFFENQSLSGGGDIDHLEFDEDDDMAVITFKDADSAYRVAQKPSLDVNGVQVQVILIRPSMRVANVKYPFDDNNFLLHRVSSRCTDDDVKSFFSLPDVNSEIRHMIFIQQRVLLQFDNPPPEFNSLRKLCLTKPLRGTMISVQRVAQTRTIQVHNTGTLTKDEIILYFEDNDKFGDCDVIDLKVYPNDNYALVEFQENTAVRRIIEEQNHRLGNRTLSVAAFYDCVGIIYQLQVNREYREGRWIGNSIRWREKLESLHQLKQISPDRLVPGLGGLALCTNEEFRIADGCRGTTVYVGITEDEREVAVKEVKKRDIQWKESMQDEVNILAKLTPHTNIVSYMWTTMPEGNLGYFVFELCEYTLEEWLTLDRVKDQSEDEWKHSATALIKGLLNGLCRLHTNDPNIIHRDLKPENILIKFQDGREYLKIADFGISLAVRSGKSANTQKRGTRKWQASEVLAGNSECIQYTLETDVQVAGMLTFYIMTRGQYPFSAKQIDEMERNIRNGCHDLSPISDPVAIDMLENMLAFDPKTRPSATSLLGHPYLWDEAKRCEFLVVIGNTVEVEYSHFLPRMLLAHELEILADNVFPNQHDWKNLANDMKKSLDSQNKTDEKFRNDIGRGGQTQSVCKLLHTIRNITNHFNTLSYEAQAKFGVSDKLYSFIHENLPQLFIRIYNLIWTSRSTTVDFTKRRELAKFFHESI